MRPKYLTELFWSKLMSVTKTRIHFVHTIIVCYLISYVHVSFVLRHILDNEIQVVLMLHC